MKRAHRLVFSRVLRLSLLLASLTGAAQGAELLPAGWLDAQVDARGRHCATRATFQDGKRLLLACGGGGAWEVELAESGPRLKQVHEFNGEVIGFFSESDGAIWVKLQVIEARPLSGAAASPRAQGDTVAAHFPDSPPAAAAPALPAKAAASAQPAPLPTPRIGKVLRSNAGEVVISLGSSDGLQRGDHIELSIEPQSPDDALEEARQVLAVGIVAEVRDRTARVSLGMNESVPVDATAAPTTVSVTASLSAPPRVFGFRELEAVARPFAAIGELGGGVLLSGGFGGRIGHLHLWGVLDPLALADAQNQRGVVAASGAVLVSYDSQYVEMGLGVGAQTVNSVTFGLSPGSGLAVAQLLRMGPQDGLSLTLRTSLVLFHSQFEFGGMVGTAQFPVTRGYWLLLSGGGGEVGYGYGEMGLRVLLRGNGQGGSHYLRVTAGGVGVFKSGDCREFFTCEPEVSYGGPMASLGSEWRF